MVITNMDVVVPRSGRSYPTAGLVTIQMCPLISSIPEVFSRKTPLPIPRPSKPSALALMFRTSARHLQGLAKVRSSLPRVEQRLNHFLREAQPVARPFQVPKQEFHSRTHPQVQALAQIHPVSLEHHRQVKKEAFRPAL